MENTVKTLMFDLASGREIFDEEQNRVISKAEANEVIRKVCFEELGLTKDSSDKQIKRALRSDRGVALMEVIEEVITTEINYGVSQNEFFNQYVETRNIADGDRNDFWVDDDVLLTVTKVAGDHHDLTIQRLGSGKPYTVNVETYGIKVGGDIRLFLTGRKDWTDLTSAVAKAYIEKVQELISYQFAKGVNLIPIPATLKGTGVLDASTKAQFDEIIDKVASANGSQVAIMGSKTALRNLNSLYALGNGVNWIAPSQKEAVAHSGILGDYEGTVLMEIPQKYKDKLLQNEIVDTKMIYIMPMVDNKFIKFVDMGETELEVSERGDNMDDMHTYEVQRKMGVSCLMTKYFGIWEL